MKTPDSPYLEFNFFFQDTPPTDAFLEVVKRFASRKPLRFFKVSAVLEGDDTTHANDGKFIEASVNDTSDLRNFLLSTRAKAQKLMTSGLMDIVSDTFEFIFLDRSSNSKGSVVSVWGDGAWLSTGPGPCTTKQRKNGRKVLDLFRELVLLLDPSYAAITIEGSLQTLEQLRSDSRSLAFSDFYLSNKFLSHTLTTAFATKFSSFRQEPLDKGRLFFCSAYLTNEENEIASHVRHEAREFVTKEIVKSM